MVLQCINNGSVDFQRRSQSMVAGIKSQIWFRLCLCAFCVITCWCSVFVLTVRCVVKVKWDGTSYCSTEGKRQD